MMIVTVVIVLIIIIIILWRTCFPKSKCIKIQTKGNIKLPLKEALQNLSIQSSCFSESEHFLFKPAELDAPAHPRALLTLAMHGGNVFQKKDDLWTALVSRYGRQMASTMMPETVDLGTERDILDTFVRPLDMYAIKSNIENGVGIKVVRGKDVLRSLRDWDKKRRPVVVQRVVQNPLLLGDKAFKLRIFLLRIRGIWYMHANGYVYRAKEPWRFPSKSGVPRLEAFIANASSLKGKDVVREYSNNVPRTLQEARDFGVLPQHSFDRMIRLFSDVVRAVPQPSDASQQAWALGADVIFDDGFRPWILECNIGPGTSAALTNAFPDLRHTRSQVEEDMIRMALPDHFTPPSSSSLVLL